MKANYFLTGRNHLQAAKACRGTKEGSKHGKQAPIRFTTLIWVFLILTNTLFSKEPIRVVSLAQSLTQNLNYLEAGHFELVGCTSYCQPREKSNIVASAVNVFIEKVVALKPDLVIATDISKPQTLDKLRALGLRVENFSTAKSFDEICQQFIHLGELVGQKEKANSIVSAAKIKVQQLESSIPPGSSPEVFLQIGANPLFTVYPGLFMNDYFRYSRSKNIAAEFTSGSISREAVILRNPEVILVVTMGMLGEEEKKTWETMNTLKASKNKNIFLLNSDEACTPTPVTFVSTLETIIRLIYKQ